MSNAFILDMKRKNMPEWDVVKASPIRVPLDYLENGKALIFNIPSVEDYFDFEAYYAEFLVRHFAESSNIDFRNIKFLSYKEFSKPALKEIFFKSLRKALAEKKIQKSLSRIIIKYFESEGFKIKKVLKNINPDQTTYIVMLIHNCIEFSKKNSLEAAQKISPQISAIFSTSSKGISEKVVQRYS